MKKTILLLAAALAALLLMGCGQGKDFDLTFVIPAGNGDTVIYAEDEMIVPQSKTLTVIPAADTPTGTLRLEALLAEEAGTYDTSAPLVAEAPVKLAVERNGWFRLGVCVPNPTEEDITMTLTVKNVILAVS